MDCAKRLEEIQNYQAGQLTIRGLHYRLVSRGMTNSQNHYKRVVEAMIKCRWEGTVPFWFFSDNDRETLGQTKYEITTPEDLAKEKFKYIKYYLENYNKNLWELQDKYVEVFIEKKALQGIFGPVCKDWNVALNPCKGYPSLTFLYDSSQRFAKAIEQDKDPLILYFGDYDPSGEDIPRSIEENLYKMGVDIHVKRIALKEDQVIKWGLPPAPAKKTDSRTANWDGLGQVELDAVEPSQLQALCENAIKAEFDEERDNELKELEKEEKPTYLENIKDLVEEFISNDNE